MAWVGFPRGIETNVEELAQRIRVQTDAPSEECLWIVEAGHQAVGEAFHRLVDRQAEVGLKIWDEAHRGQGWGRGSLDLLLDYLWRTTEVEAVILDTWEKNLPARRCYESLGFVCQGPLPPWTDQEGVPRTALAYRLDRPAKENRVPKGDPAVDL